MKYYKVIANGTVIDANFVWLKWQEKNRILIGCDAEDAQFIQSTVQAHVWRVPWLNPVPAGAGEYETVEAVEITEEEYITIRQQLDDGFEVVEPEEPETPVEPDPEEGTEETPTEPVMTPEEMRRKITQLEAALEEQTMTNEFLMGCLLEMSEVVYD